MNAHEVIYKLKLVGKTQRSIAIELGVSHATVNNTLHGRTKSLYVATAIAAMLGQPLSRVFPDAYPDQPSDVPTMSLEPEP